MRPHILWVIALSLVLFPADSTVEAQSLPGRPESSPATLSEFRIGAGQLSAARPEFSPKWPHDSDSDAGSAADSAGSHGENCESSVPALLQQISSEADNTAEVMQSDAAADFERRIQHLEAELHGLRNSPRTDSYSCSETRLQCQDAGTGGLFGSVEVSFLRPHVSGAVNVFGLAPSGGRMIDSQYQTSLRYVLGYRDDSGLGVRGRYWSFDDDFEFTQPFAPARFGIRMDVADAEVTLSQRLRHLDLEFSGGLRYGKLEYSTATAGPFGVGLLTFEGVGPTMALSGRRALGNTGLSIYGNVRGSWLVGDIRNGSVLIFMPRGSIEEELMQVYENQLGIAWTHTMQNHMQFEIRTAWETQYWLNNVLSDDVYGIGSNLGFTGPAITAELKY